MFNEIDIGSVLKIGDFNWKVIDKNEALGKNILTLEFISENINFINHLNDLIEAKQYKEAAEYLIDNDGFIAEQDINLFEKIIKNKTKKRYFFKDIYYSKAESYRDSGEKEKAIKYYNKYIEESVKGNIAVDVIEKLIVLYSELKKFDKAIELLNKIINRSIKCQIIDKKMNDLYFQVYVNKINNSKENTDENSLKELEKYYNQLIYSINYNSNENIYNDKIKYSIEIANVFYNIGNLAKSISYIDKVYFYFSIMKNKNIKFDTNIKTELIKLFENLILVTKNYNNSNYNISQNIENLLLKIDENKKRNASITNKTISPKINFDSNIDIFLFIKKQIESQDPHIRFPNYNKIQSEEELKNFIKNNIYVEKNNIPYHTSEVYKISYKELADRNFAIAQIIIMKNKNGFKDVSFFKEKYYLAIAEGCCLYANSRLYVNSRYQNIDEQKKLDEARYGYLQNIIWYKRSKEKNINIEDRTSWGISVKRYIKSFFIDSEKLEKDDISSLYDINSEAKNTELVQNTLSEYILNTAYPDSLLLKFTIGMIELLFNSDINEDDVLKIILRSPYKNKITGYLFDIIDKKNETIDYLKDLKVLWKEATKKYNSFAFEPSEVFGLIKKCLENLFEIGEFKKSFYNLEHSESKYFKRVLSKMKDSNYQYMEQLCETLKSVREYNEKEPDYKIKHLVDIKNKLDKIFNSIEEYPTFFYYETPWGIKDDKGKNLRDIVNDNIEKEKRKLLEKNEVKLNVSAEYSSWDENKNIIEVNLTLENKSKRDLDNIEICSVISKSKYIKNLTGEIKPTYLDIYEKPRDVKKLKFKIDIDKDKLEESDFYFDVKISYTYRDILDYNNRIPEEKNYTLTISLDYIKNFEEIENPFKKWSDGTDVKDRKMFYGRDDYIDSIVSLVINDKEHRGKCLAIYGQRRAGKTSLLNFLQKELRKKAKDDIIVSFGNIDLLSRNGKITLKEFLSRILRLLEDEINKNHRNLLPLLTENGISIDVDKMKDNDLLMENFDRQFGKICEFIHSNNKQIVFTIDEFTSICDLIRKGTMTDDFMKFWKAFIQNYSVFAILICQDHMKYLLSDSRFTNALSTTEVKRITYLEEKYAKEMMYKPILDDENKSRYTDEALDYLYDLTSGSAYLIMKLCAGLVDYLNEIRNPKITKSVIEEYLHKNITTEFGENIFEPQYYDKSSDIKEQIRIAEENKNIIKEIAQNSDKEGWLDINVNAISEEDKKLIRMIMGENLDKDSCLNINDNLNSIEVKKLKKLLDNLESRDVLIKKDGKYKIKVDLYRQWILAKEGGKKVNG